MANVGLPLDADFQKDFEEAQHNITTKRGFVLNIDEEKISLKCTINIESDINDDLLRIRTLLEDQPCFIIFCLSSSENEGSNDNKGRKWALIAYVPETSSKKLKMLFSSSRYSMKHSLGFGLFISDHTITEKDELTFDLLKPATDKELEAMKSDQEKSLEDEKASYKQEATVLQLSGMKLLPFDIAPDASEALQGFARKTFDFVEINFSANEIFKLVKSEKFSSVSEVTFQDIMKLISSDPTLIILRHEEKIVSIFNCPEDTKIKEKVRLSTCKATFKSTLKEHGIEIERGIEITALEDIELFLAPEVFDESGTSSAAAAITMDKPKKPQRRASTMKLKKFVPIIDT